MARLRFPGRPGYRFDRIGVRYGADEASQTTDPTLAIVASIHRGLRHFRDLFGDSDEEEEFHGFSAKEISAAESKLRQAVREEQLLDEKRTEELKVRYERSQARLANYEAAGLMVPARPLMSRTGVRRTYRKLIESDLVTDARSKLVNRTNFVSEALDDTSGHVVKNKRNGSVKSIKVKRLTVSVDSQGFGEKKRGRPKNNIPSPSASLDLSPSKGEHVASSNLFSAKPLSRYNTAAQHILAKAKHAAQNSSSKVRKFVLPTKSSRSSRVIKPNKRFLEEDSVQNLVACKQTKFGTVFSPSLPAPSSSTFSLDVGDEGVANSFSVFYGQGLSLSALTANREKGFPSFSTAPQPSGITSFTDGVACQKPLGLLDRPLIVEGKRPKKPSLIMRMKLVEDNAEDEILLQQQLADVVSPGKPVSSYPNDTSPEEEEKSCEPSTSSPLLGKGFGLGKSLIAPAKLFTDTSKPSQPSSTLFKHRKVVRLSDVSSQSTVVLRQAKLQLNRTALNRSKAALARSLKAKLKREAKLERRKRISEKRKSSSDAGHAPSTAPPPLSQLSPFSQACVAADIDRQKSGLFEGMSEGIGSFSPNGMAATPDTTWSYGPTRHKPESEMKKDADEECQRTLEELNHLRKQKYAVGGNYPCLVCGNMCRVKHNRKLPNVPLCKPCKKFYFFQINSQGVKPKERICSKFGCCVVLGQPSRGLVHYCIACKFQKFQAACSFSNTWRGESILLSKHCSSAKSSIGKSGGKKLRHKSGDSKSETEGEQTPIKKQRHQSGDGKHKEPTKRVKHRSGESKSGDFSDLKQTGLSPMSKKDLINAKNLDKPLSVDVSGDHLLGNLSPPQTQSSPLLSPSKSARSPTKKASKTSGERDSDNSRNDDDNPTRTSSRGPRIKHVCRRAAMVFPQQRATFPDAQTAGRVLTLSALPNEEKEQLLARTKNESRKSMHSSEEESCDEAKETEADKKPPSPPKREEVKERKASTKKTYQIEKLSSLKKRQKKEEKKRLWSEKRSQFRLQGGKRRIRCQKCEGCKTPDCGECIFCKDKTKFGGPNKIRKSCLKAICTAPRYSRKATHAFINPKSPKENGDEDDDNSGNFRPTNNSFVNGLASRSSSARLSAREPTNYQSLDGGSGNGASDSMEEGNDHEMDVESSLGPEKPRNGLDMDGSQLRLKTNFSSNTNSRASRSSKVPKMVEATVQLALTEVRVPNLSRIGDSFLGKLGNMKGKDKLSLAQRTLMDLPLVNSETAYLSEVPLKSHLIRADYREDYDVETAWYHGFSLTITGTSCVRTLCYLCGSAGKDELIFCIVCCQPYHSFCLEDDERPEENGVEKDGDETVTEDHQHQLQDSSALTWCCRRCQFCNVCGLQNGLLKCNRCRDMYHPHCLGSNYPTKPSRKKNIWVCTKCVRCKSCGATTPGVGTSATWTYDFSLCYDCGKLMDKGNFCPVCHKCYSDDDWESKMIHCAICDSWVHAKCEELTDEMYQLLSCLPDDIQFTCRVCSPEKKPYWEQLLKSEFVTGLLNVYNCLMSSKCTQSLMEAGPPRPKAVKGKPTDKPNNGWTPGDGNDILSSAFPHQNTLTEACLSQGEDLCPEKGDLQQKFKVPSSSNCSGRAEASLSKTRTENDKIVVEPDMEMNERPEKTGGLVFCTAGLDSGKASESSVDSVVHRLCHSRENCGSEILSSSTSVSCTTSLSVISTTSHSNLSEQNGCETELNQTSDNVQQCSSRLYYPSLRQEGCPRVVNVFGDKHEGKSPICVGGNASQGDSDTQKGLSNTMSCVNQQGECCPRVSLSSSTDSVNSDDLCDPEVISPMNCLQNVFSVHPPSMQEQTHSTNALDLQGKSTSEYANCNGFVSHHSHVRPESSSLSSSVSPSGCPKLTLDDSHSSQSQEGSSPKRLELESCSYREEFKETSNSTDSCGNGNLNSLVTSKEQNQPNVKFSSSAEKLPNDGCRDMPAISDSPERQSGTNAAVSGDETAELNNVATSSNTVETNSPSKDANKENQNQGCRGHVSFRPSSPNLVMECSFDCARDFNEVRVKIQSGHYKGVEEFSEDMVRIIQYTLKENSATFTRRKQANSMRSIFVKQMERNFPWFNVNTCKLWDHNRGFPEGMLKDAVLPPSSDHTYAQWMARQEIPMSPQPSPFKNIRSPLWPSSGDDLSPSETIVLEHGLTSPNPSTEDDSRCCLLCGMYGDGLSQDSGRLLYCGQNEWIHIHCALWSAEVFEANDGSLQNVHDTVSRGKKLRCNLCQQAGATVGCCEANCPANYHFMCARQDNCVFQEDKRMFCKLHTHHVDGEVIKEKRFETHRRVCVDIDRIRNKSWGKAVDPSFLSVLVGSCTVEKLGELKPQLSDTEDCLLPVGFTCTRIYWSTRDARRRCVYTCRIIEVKPETESSELRIKDIRVVHDENHPDFVPYDQLNLDSYGIPNFTLLQNFNLLPSENEDGRDVICLGSSNTLGHGAVPSHTSSITTKTLCKSQARKPVDLTGLSASTLALLNIKDPTNYIPPKKQVSRQGGTYNQTRSEDNEELGLIQIANRLNKAASGDSVPKKSSSMDKLPLPTQPEKAQRQRVKRSHSLSSSPVMFQVTSGASSSTSTSTNLHSSVVFPKIWTEPKNLPLRARSESPLGARKAYEIIPSRGYRSVSLSPPAVAATTNFSFHGRKISINSPVSQYTKVIGPDERSLVVKEYFSPSVAAPPIIELSENEDDESSAMENAHKNSSTDFLPPPSSEDCESTTNTLNHKPESKSNAENNRRIESPTQNASNFSPECIQSILENVPQDLLEGDEVKVVLLTDTEDMSEEDLITMASAALGESKSEEGEEGEGSGGDSSGKSGGEDDSVETASAPPSSEGGGAQQEDQNVPVSINVESGRTENQRDPEEIESLDLFKSSSEFPSEEEQQDGSLENLKDSSSRPEPCEDMAEEPTNLDGNDCGHKKSVQADAVSSQSSGDSKTFERKDQKDDEDDDKEEKRRKGVGRCAASYLDEDPSSKEENIEGDEEEDEMECVEEEEESHGVKDTIGGEEENKEEDTPLEILPSTHSMDLPDGVDSGSHASDVMQAGQSLKDQRIDSRKRSEVTLPSNSFSGVALDNASENLQTPDLDVTSSFHRDMPVVMVISKDNKIDSMEGEKEGFETPTSLTQAPVRTGEDDTSFTTLDIEQPREKGSPTVLPQDTGDENGLGASIVDIVHEPLVDGESISGADFEEESHLVDLSGLDGESISEPVFDVGKDNLDEEENEAYPVNMNSQEATCLLDIEKVGLAASQMDTELTESSTEKFKPMEDAAKPCEALNVSLDITKASCLEGNLQPLQTGKSSEFVNKEPEDNGKEIARIKCPEAQEDLCLRENEISVALCCSEEKDMSQDTSVTNMERAPVRDKTVPETTDEESDYLVLEDLSFDDTHDEDCNDGEKGSQELVKERSSESPKIELSAALVKESNEKGGRKSGNSLLEANSASGDEVMGGIQTDPQVCPEKQSKTELEPEGEIKDGTTEISSSNCDVGNLTSVCVKEKASSENLSQELEADATQIPMSSPGKKEMGGNKKKVLKEYPLRRRGNRFSTDMKRGSSSDSEALKVKPSCVTLDERSNLSDYERKAKNNKSSSDSVQDQKRADLNNKQRDLKTAILSLCPKDTDKDGNDGQVILIEEDKLVENKEACLGSIQENSAMARNETSDKATASTSHQAEDQIRLSAKSPPVAGLKQDGEDGHSSQWKTDDEVFQDSDGFCVSSATETWQSKISEKIRKESFARSSPGENGPYRCPTCKRVYRTVDSYEAHVQICDFEVSTSDEDETSAMQENSTSKLFKEQAKKEREELSSGSNVINNSAVKSQAAPTLTSVDVHQPLSIIITDDFKDVKFSPLGQDLSDDGSSVHSQDSRRSLRKSTLTQRNVAPAHLAKVRVRDSKSTASPDSTCSSLLSPKASFGGKVEEKVSPKETMLEAVGLVSRRSLDVALSPNALDTDAGGESVASRTRTMKLQPRISPTTMAVAPKREKKSPAQSCSATSKLSIMAGGMKKEEKVKEKGVMIAFPEVVEDVQMDAPKHARRQRRQKRIWYVEESESSGDEAEAEKDEALLVDEEDDERGVAGRTRHSRQRLSLESKPMEEKKSKLTSGGAKEKDGGEKPRDLTKCETESPKSVEVCSKKISGKDADRERKVSSMAESFCGGLRRTRSRSSPRNQGAHDKTAQDNNLLRNNAVKKESEKPDDGNKDEVDAAAIITGEATEEHKQKSDEDLETEGALVSPLRRSRRPSNKTAKLNEYLANLKREHGEDSEEEDKEDFVDDQKSGAESNEQPPSAPTEKRGRGRPRIHPIKIIPGKKGRGRPRKDENKEVDGAGVERKPGQLKLEMTYDRKLGDTKRDGGRENTTEEENKISPKKQAGRVETRRSSLRSNRTNFEVKSEEDTELVMVERHGDQNRYRVVEKKNILPKDRDYHISTLPLGDLETSHSKVSCSSEPLLSPGKAKDESHVAGPVCTKTEVVDLTEDDDQKDTSTLPPVKVSSQPDLQQVLPSHVTDAMRSSGQKLRIVVRSPNVEAAQKIGELLRKTAMNLTPAAADISVTMTNIPEKPENSSQPTSADQAPGISANRDVRDVESQEDLTKTQNGKSATTGELSDGSKTRHDAETPLVSRSASPDSISAAYDIQSDDFSSETSNDCYDAPAKAKDSQTADNINNGNYKVSSNVVTTRATSNTCIVTCANRGNSETSTGVVTVCADGGNSKTSSNVVMCTGSGNNQTSPIVVTTRSDGGNEISSNIVTTCANSSNNQTSSHVVTTFTNSNNNKTSFNNQTSSHVVTTFSNSNNKTSFNNQTSSHVVTTFTNSNNNQSSFNNQTSSHVVTTLASCNTSMIPRQVVEEDDDDDDVIIGEVHGLQPPDPSLMRQPRVITTLPQIGKAAQPLFPHTHTPFVVSPPPPIITLSPKRSPVSGPCLTTLGPNTSPQSQALQATSLSAPPFVVSEISPGRYFIQSAPANTDFPQPKQELAQSKVLMQTPTATLLQNSSQPGLLFQTGAQPSVSIPNPSQPQPQTANLLLQHSSPPGVLLQQPPNQPTQPGLPVGSLLQTGTQPALSFLALANPRIISPQLSLQSLNPSAINIPSILQQPTLNTSQPLLQSTVNANQTLLQQSTVNVSQPLVSILAPPTVYVPNLVQQPTQIQPPPPPSPQQPQLMPTLGGMPFASPIGSQNPVNQTFNSSSLNLVTPVTSTLSAYHRVQSPIQASLAVGKSTIPSLPPNFSVSSPYQPTPQMSTSLPTSQPGHRVQQQQPSSALQQLAATASRLQPAPNQTSQPSQQLMSSIQQMAAASASRTSTTGNQPVQSAQRLRAMSTPAPSPLLSGISSIQPHISPSKAPETDPLRHSNQELQTKVNYMGSFELNSANLQSLMNPQAEEHERSRSILELVKSALICPKGKAVPGVEVRPMMTQTPQGPKRVLRVFIDEDHLKNTNPSSDESTAHGSQGHQASGKENPSHQASDQGRILPNFPKLLATQSQSINSGSKTSGEENSYIQIPISQKGGQLFSTHNSRNSIQEGTQLRRPLKFVHSAQPTKRKFPASLYQKGVHAHDRGPEVKRPHVDQRDRSAGTIRGCYQQVVTRVLQPEVEQNPWQQVQTKADKHNSLMSLLSSTSSSAPSHAPATTTTPTKSTPSSLSSSLTAPTPSSLPLPPSPSSVIQASSSSLETAQASRPSLPVERSPKSPAQGATACQILQPQLPPPLISKPHPVHQPAQTQVSPHKRASFPTMAPVEKASAEPSEGVGFSRKLMRKHLLKKMKSKETSSKVTDKKKSQSGPRRLKTASLEGAHPLIHHKKSGASLPQPCLEEEVVATPMDVDSGRDHPREGASRSQRPRNESQLKFEITSEDGFSCQGDTMEDAWNQVIEKVKDVRAAARMKQLSYAGISGRNMYGVNHDAVVYLIEQLYGAVHCHHNYKFRFHRYDLELADQEVPLNASGSARSEIFLNRKPYDMFNFLKSVYRVKPGDGEREMEEEMALKSARRATSLSLPMAMRFRKLKTFAKEAVDVYRSKIHGRGLFCKRNIDAGEMVIEYAGEVIRASLTDKREKYYESKGIGCYMFRIDEDEVVDATMHGSAARFINHSCEPNCFSKVIQVDGKKHIVIFAMRPIKRGEELTYDYKFPIEEVKIPCHCGSKRCRKYLN